MHRDLGLTLANQILQQIEVWCSNFVAQTQMMGSRKKKEPRLLTEACSGTEN